MDYSPFPKAFNEIVVDDLALLRTVSEGWYVEYKREVPSSDSIAKSISAFGNTYGGWLFYGVDEKSKADSVAGGFPGIPHESIDSGLQKIRQSVSMHMNPAIHYEVLLLSGPSAEIDLASDRSVIVIYVPMSFNTPVVHKSGRIYKRVADGSEPLPENDKFMLEKLWERSREVGDNYRSWLENDPFLSEREKEIPYIRLMIAPSLYEAYPVKETLSLKILREKFGPVPSSKNHLPFDSIYNSAAGFIARQCLGNDPSTMTLTWKIKNNLSSELLIPLSVFTLNLSDQPWLQHYSYIDRFESLATDLNYLNAGFVDLNLIFPLLLAAVDMQAGLQKTLGGAPGFYAKIKIVNTNRVKPYLDTKSYIDDIGSFGIPVCFDSSVVSPPGYKPESFVRVAEYPDMTENECNYMAACVIFALIGRCFGLTGFHEFGDETASPLEYFQAGERSKKVQSSRNGH